MVPLKTLKLAVALVTSLSIAPLASTQAERSPVFGSATVEALSLEASRDIMARGFWADYHGNLAISFAYTAYIYAFYARYYAGSNTANERAWYEVAMSQAYWAYINAWYAMIYSAAGV